METVLYWFARALIALLQRLPLRLVARLGRWGGGLAYWLDGRHRRVALSNLAKCFGAGHSRRRLGEIARENFRRIGENFAAAVRTSAMSPAQISEVLTVCGTDKLLPQDRKVQGCYIAAIGHFGNFELYARGSQWVPGYRFATTYRALRQPSLNRLLQRLRERSGCMYFERRSEMSALREAMRGGNMVLGFLADQHAGDRGLPVPLFGELCSTTTAPAVFALRYKCPLFVAICYRTALARWQIDVGPQIPTHENGQARSVEDITLDMNRAFEEAIRRDPANWFWVHERWKPGKFRPGPHIS